jgi:proteic killer suppression protein
MASRFLFGGQTEQKNSGKYSPAAFRKLQLLDDATCNLDLRSPPGNHFEKLAGRLKGTFSIRVNDQYRLLFSWNDERGEADKVYLDNHSYR